MNAQTITAAEFRQHLERHLSRALQVIPDVVPQDVFDPVAAALMEELDAIDGLLYDLGAEERQREQTEVEIQRKTAAKRRDASLEDRAMRVDHSVQRAIEMLGVDAGSWRIVGPMQADMLAKAFIHFLDALPADAFAEDRIIPPGFPSSYDPTVAGLIALMRERKGRTLVEEAR